jgi:anti-sigma factor RsiW
MVSNDVFFAWLDGELSGAEAARVEAEVAADPELSRLAREHRSLRSQLKGAFDPIAGEAVPPPLLDEIREPQDVFF